MFDSPTAPSPRQWMLVSLLLISMPYPGLSSSLMPFRSQYLIAIVLSLFLIGQYFVLAGSDEESNSDFTCFVPGFITDAYSFHANARGLLQRMSAELMGKDFRVGENASELNSLGSPVITSSK
jgi:hypothetical protein